MSIDQKYKDDYVSLKLTNVPIYWAHVHKPDTAFGNNKWSVEMRIDDEKLVKALKDEGFNVRDKTTSSGELVKNVLVAKKERFKRNGDEQQPPKVVGPDGVTPFTEDIGNGSICNLICSAKAWPVGGSYRLSLYLDAIQVVKHVPYSGSTSFTEAEEGSSGLQF